MACSVAWPVSAFGMRCSWCSTGLDWRPFAPDALRCGAVRYNSPYYISCAAPQLNVFGVNERLRHIAVCCGENNAICRASTRRTAAQRVRCEQSLLIQCVWRIRCEQTLTLVSVCTVNSASLLSTGLRERYPTQLSNFPQTLSLVTESDLE